MDLASKNTKWSWEPTQRIIFETIKELIAKNVVLTHYDSNKPHTIDTDASTCGLGAILPQISYDAERLIAFASRVLKDAERINQKLNEKH